VQISHKVGRREAWPRRRLWDQPAPGAQGMGTWMMELWSGENGTDDDSGLAVFFLLPGGTMAAWILLG